MREMWPSHQTRTTCKHGEVLEICGYEYDLVTKEMLKNWYEIEIM